MNTDEERIVNPRRKKSDGEIDYNLRPRTLEEYIGQDKIKENLKILIAAARQRKEPVDHLLFSGPPGLGKTTLAYIIAREMGVEIKVTSGPVLERPGDLAAILTGLSPGDILFIDEVHRLSRLVEEVLYPAMEEYSLDIIIGQGPAARSIRLDLPRFTLIGATTRAGLITSPMRDRFGAVFRLDFYELSEMTRIVERSARLLNIKLDPDGAREIARRSRRTPRVANRLLRRIRDYAQIKADGIITMPVAKDALEMLGVDEAGLDQMDRRLMMTILEKFNGGPVGVENLSVAVAEEVDTIEDVYEPYLIQIGFLQRTASGRKATELGFSHFKKKPNLKPGELF